MPIDYTKANRNNIKSETWVKMENLAEQIADYYFDKCKEFSNKLRPINLALNTNDMQKLIGIQTDTLILRQDTQDEISDALNKLSEKNVDLKKITADRIEYYATGHGAKYSDKKMTESINADLVYNQKIIKTIENYIEHLRECKQACDQVGYALKNRSDLMNHLGK